MKRLLLFLILIVALPVNARTAEFSVPTRVSQGHAFPVSVTDDEPFDAIFRWRGENLSVHATGDGSLWKAEALLAMPLDAQGQHTVSVTFRGKENRFLIRAKTVPWPKSILKVLPKYVQPPGKCRNRSRATENAAAGFWLPVRKNAGAFLCPVPYPAESPVLSEGGGCSTVSPAPPIREQTCAAL